MDLFDNLECFLRPNTKAEIGFKNLTKHLYDDAKKSRTTLNKAPAAKEINSLIVDHMDDEAIWTQLDVENQNFLKGYVKEFCQNEQPEDEKDNFVNDDEDNEIYDTDDSMSEDNLDGEESDLDVEGSDLNEEEENLDDKQEFDEEDLNEEDLIEEGEEEDEELNEDLGLDSELDEESDDDTLFNPKKTANINFDEELSDEEADNESNEENDGMLSEFQKQDAKAKEKVKKLEEEFLKEKPWQLKGEIRASERPQDSLLEEYVDFESAVRPVPIYTEEFTKKLEDIILQRVKTNKFDSVEKKERTVEQPFDYKRRILLDTEKNKEGLAKVYENEYLKQKNQTKSTDNPVHNEIKEKMRRIFMQLDSLCNFNYVPKASNSEIKIVNNLPAINVEEAIPEAISDAALVAPQEILPIQKTDLKVDSEKSKTEKSRERRLKKKLVKNKIKLREEKGLSNNFKNFKNNDKLKKSAVDSESVKKAFMKKRSN